MAFVIASNTTVWLALWAGLISVLLSIFTICYMFILRGRTTLEKNRGAAATEKWQERIYEIILGTEPKASKDEQEVYKLTAEDKKDVLRTYIEKGRFDPVEPLPKEELPHFLFLWNYLHESLRGGSKEQLNSFALTLKMDDRVYKMLKSRSLKKRLLSINTFGNLREKKAYDEIRKLVAHRDPVLSLWAWRALLRIDFDETLDCYFRLIAERADWSPIFVAKVLLEQDSDLISAPLVRLVEKCFEDRLAERQLARLISYLTITHVSAYSPLIDRILAESDRPEVVIACLRLVKTDESLAKVRALLKSERWEIRLQVVQTLGRLGHAEDLDLLIYALNDLDWWVRYRAAQAIWLLPSMNVRKFERLAENQPNEFARDMLRQVLAEEQLICFNQTPPSILSR